MYTVKQVSKLAGVTPRTLRYYDEIGLLKPPQVGDNGYRYYDEDSLLRLQQILFYRQLDMPLEDIRGIMERDDFDVLSALESHRDQLSRRIRKIKRLIQTVDQTIDHMKGTQTMSSDELFIGFNEEQQAQYEKEAMEMYNPEVVRASNQKWRNSSTDEKRRVLEEGKAVYLDIIEAMPKGSASPEVQEAVDRWRRNIEFFWIPNDEQLIGLTELYNNDPRFKGNFDKMHPELAAFIREAVQVYVDRRKRSE